MPDFKKLVERYESDSEGLDSWHRTDSGSPFCILPHTQKQGMIKAGDLKRSVQQNASISTLISF